MVLIGTIGHLSCAIVSQLLVDVQRRVIHVYVLRQGGTPRSRLHRHLLPIGIHSADWTSIVHRAVGREARQSLFGLGSARRLARGQGGGGECLQLGGGGGQIGLF
jgi:hypothetical protein